MSVLVIEAGNHRNDDPKVKYASGYMAISTSAVSLYFVFCIFIIVLFDFYKEYTFDFNTEKVDTYGGAKISL